MALGSLPLRLHRLLDRLRVSELRGQDGDLKDEHANNFDTDDNGHNTRPPVASALAPRFWVNLVPRQYHRDLSANMPVSPETLRINRQLSRDCSRNLYSGNGFTFKCEPVTARRFLEWPSRGRRKLISHLGFEARATLAEDVEIRKDWESM